MPRIQPLPNNPTTEGDVLLGLACGDLTSMFAALDADDFYDVRHRYLFLALRHLCDRARLHKEVEVRVAGRRVAQVEDAFGHPSVWVGFCVPGLRDALLELGAPNVRALVRYFEGLFLTNIPAWPTAVDRLRAMADDRRRLFELDSERDAIADRWAS